MKSTFQIHPVLAVCLAVCLTLTSGCLFICEEISDQNKYASCHREQAKARVSRLAAGERLRKDFEIVFRDPAYLSATNTPERAALLEYFATATDAVPSVGQLDRLIETIGRRSELVEPLRSLWQLPQVTPEQRQKFAVLIDQGAVASTNTVLECVLPHRRLSDAEIAAILKKVGPNGTVATHLGEIRRRRQDFRSQVESKRAAEQQRRDRETATARSTANAAAPRQKVQPKSSREERERDAYGQLAATVKRGLFGPPDDIRRTLDAVVKNPQTNLVWRVFADCVPRYARSVPSTNLVLFIEWAASRLEPSNILRPRNLCMDLLRKECLDRRVFRICLPRFLGMVQFGKPHVNFRSSRPLGGSNCDLTAFHGAADLLGCSYLEDEELILAYDQAWTLPVVEECFKRGRSAEERAQGDLILQEVARCRNRAVETGASQEDFEAQGIEIVRKFRPQNLPVSWFDYLDIVHGNGRRRSSATIRPYGQLPLAEALRKARAKLDEKKARWREEDAVFDLAVERVRNLSVDQADAARSIVTNLANATFRRVILDSVRWNTNAIPVGNLRALVDWELKANPERNLDLYSLMRRPEWTEELLRTYYPALLALTATTNGCQGVRGILDNPRVPQELVDRAYREPQLARLRLDYVRQRYAKQLKPDVAMAIECEVASVESQDAMNNLKVDRILKKYLPASRPPDWSWRMSQPEFDFFMNEEDIVPPTPPPDLFWP